MQIMCYIDVNFFTSNNVATSRPSDIRSSRELSETPDKLNCKCAFIVPLLKLDTHQTFVFPLYPAENIISSTSDYVMGGILYRPLSHTSPGLS